MALVLGSCGAFGSGAIPGRGTRRQRRPKGSLSWTKMFKGEQPRTTTRFAIVDLVGLFRVWIRMFKIRTCVRLFEPKQMQQRCSSSWLPLHWYQEVSKYFKSVNRFKCPWGMMQHDVQTGKSIPDEPFHHENPHLQISTKNQNDIFYHHLCLKCLKNISSHSSLHSYLHIMSVFLDVILLMVQKSGYPLDLGVVSPIICRVLAPSKRWLGMGFLNPSTVFLRIFGKTKIQVYKGRRVAGPHRWIRCLRMPWHLLAVAI